MKAAVDEAKRQRLSIQLAHFKTAHERGQLCVGTSTVGLPCRNLARPGSQYCGVHRGLAGGR